VTGIGFMQGRLSPLVDGRIQAFPWDHWRGEFAVAAGMGFPLMEWTLDEARLDANPLLTADGRGRIRHLSATSSVRIESMTGDFLMQAPLLRSGAPERDRLLAELERVIDACADLGIQHLVWPLVDNGRLERADEEDRLVDLVRNTLADRLRQGQVQIAFESDYPPDRLAALMARLPEDLAGVNYDIGNSASLGFAPASELEAYGKRVVNVHVKDRCLGGGTVPLGTGAADFRAVVDGLRRAGYGGRFILQTARATDEDHAGALSRARDFFRRALDV
jgi:hexulose-6-phosphate isomerase